MKLVRVSLMKDQWKCAAAGPNMDGLVVMSTCQPPHAAFPSPVHVKVGYFSYPMRELKGKDKVSKAVPFVIDWWREKETRRVELN